MLNNPIKYSAKNTTFVDNQIGEKLTALRKSMGLSRADLAEKIGITHQQLQKYEKGINRISASRLYEITLFFGVEMQDFFDVDTMLDGKIYELIALFKSLDSDDKKDAVIKLAAMLKN